MRVSFEPDQDTSYVLVTAMGERSIPEHPIYGVADPDVDAFYYDEGESDEGTAEVIVDRLERSPYCEGEIEHKLSAPHDTVRKKAEKHFGDYIRDFLNKQTELDDFR